MPLKGATATGGAFAYSNPSFGEVIGIVTFIGTTISHFVIG